MPATPLAPKAIPPNNVQLTGPLYLGDIFNWALFGVLSVQTYIYFLAFPNDRVIPTKAIVFLIFVSELVQTVVTTRDGSNIFGYGWGDLGTLNLVGLQWFSVPLMTGTISAVIQLFYAWRIWILSHQPYIPVFISLVALLQGGAGIWSGINAKLIGIFSQIQLRNGTPTIVWLSGTAVCDALIAFCMIYYLSKSRTGFRATNELLVKLIRITVETGLITATVAVVDLIMFLAFEKANYHAVPAMVLSKLYSNSLLVLLNARVRIVGGRNVGTATIDDTLSWAQSAPSHHQVVFRSGARPLSRLSHYERTTSHPFNIEIIQETSTNFTDSSTQKLSSV
ncbi:hypothetical protein AMATHDRAFT_68360 [Amanita thiersii Skay4041]|uniref:DUF6534 domain-containing protein n=1 Tax=Amanita thiersii Skay4041 TaxID=703135 RepID=A0A2A9NAP6_9AGAR|nr:hypothetical protein AMATHDRAFT_68360 [Amanita thiersii Skay4041]